jgi:thiol-disulfide isomerase/thioredoxin
MACIAARPIVDGIEAEFANSLVVVRLNVQDPAHQPAVQKYRVLGTPTFIFLDSRGQEAWRGIGHLDAQAVRNLMNAP